MLDAARRRIERIFADFDNVIVAFSGGKDSGVMLQLVLQYMRDHDVKRRVHVFHLDYEGQYSATTRYVDEVMASDPDLIVPWRVCLPVAAGCAVTMYADHWRPWDPQLRELWVRELPDHDGVIHTGNVPEGFPDYHGSWDYEFHERFERWHHEWVGARRTAVLVGIREQESLHRCAAIHRADKHAMHDGLRWTSRLTRDVIKAYPVHDWLLQDVWHAHARFGWSYNRLYDLLHHAGVPPHQMRVTSPFISQGIRQLQLYRAIDPELWARLVGRVNGVNFAALYGATRAMAARDVRLPDGHTWQTYLRLILDSLPPHTRERYEAKFATSRQYWTGTGGALKADTVRQLRAAGVRAEYRGPPTSARRYTVPHEIVRFDDYPDDLPSVRDFATVPTYKRMCITVLRNDYTCRYMGFSPTKLEKDRRQAAIEKYEQVQG